MMRSHPDHTDAQLSDEISPGRRRLLKAAASTAPLIATLPSGAAIANASAINCVIKEQEEATAGMPQPINPGGTYITVTGYSEVYDFGSSGGQVTVYFFNTLGGTSVQVDANGNWVDVSGATLVDGSRDDATFLVVFRTDAYPATAVSQDCDISTGLDWDDSGGLSPTGSDYCIGPIAKVSTAQPGNIGLGLSCYNSISPDDWTNP